MTRIIKYRAWNKKEKIMKYDFFGKGCYLYWFEEEGYRQWEDIEKDFIVMEYIGLLDKNGKEVYEDDILKSDYGDIFKATIRLLFSENEVEIIGNIHQHPELLQ